MTFKNSFTRQLLLVISISLFFFINTYAQSLNVQWGKVWTGSGFQLIDMSCDNNGDMVYYSYITATVDVDPSPAVYNLSPVNNQVDDFAIAKLDSSGNFLWAEKIGNGFTIGGTCCQVDANNNIYFLLQFMGTLDIDPGPGTVSVTALPTYSNFVIVKLNSQGNYVGHIILGNSVDEVRIMDFVITPVSRLYINTCCGNTGAVDMDAGPGVAMSNSYARFTAVYDTSLVYKSAISDSNSNSIQGTFVNEDKDGNMYFIKNYNDSTDLDPGPAVYHFPQMKPTYGNYCIVKMDSTYTIQWVTGFYDPDFSSDRRASLISDDGSVYISSVLNSSIYPNYNAPNFAITVSNLNAYYFLKWDRYGVYQKGFKLDGYILMFDNCMKIDHSNRVYLTGGFGHTMDFDGGAGVANLQSVNNTFYDSFLAIYDGNLNFLSAYSIGEPNDEQTGCSALDKDDNFYAGITFEATVDVDVNQGYYNITELPPTGNGSYGIIKYSTDSFGGSVWPGDANNDLVANNYDLLPIGLYYGSTGPARTAMNNTWSPHVATNWSSTQTNGANYKFADCNGNGTINMVDTLAVNQNYSLIHTFRTGNTASPLSSTAQLHFQTTSPAYLPGSWVDVDVLLGDASNPLSIYGLAFNIDLDLSLVKPGTAKLLYPASWFGTPLTNTLTISNVYNDAAGAITRYDHNNAFGYGKIATLRFQLDSTISAAASLNLNLINYQAYDSSGALINLTSAPLSILVDPFLSLNDNDDASYFTVFPNPAKTNLNFHFNNDDIGNKQIDIMDVEGKKMSTENSDKSNSTININELKPGIYFAKVSTEKYSVVKRFIKH